MIKVRCPATSANLGSGFDICGMALAQPSDLLSVELAQKDELAASAGFPVPKMERNVCYPVLSAMRADYGIKERVRVAIEKNIPPASGLGSSGASSAGMAFALNELFSLCMSQEQLVHYAALGEKMAAGTAHADNVAPAITGGVCVMVGSNPVRLARFDAPRGLVVGVLQTNRTKPSTEYARKVLPATISRADHHFNAAALSMLLVSLYENDAELFVKSLDDRVIEPARAAAGILPKLAELRQLCFEHGFGACASGAGPALLVAGVESNKDQRALEQEIIELYDGMKPVLSWTSVSPTGCVVVGR